MRPVSTLIFLCLFAFQTVFAAKDAQSYYEEGLQSLVQKNYIKAVGDFTNAISLSPHFAEAYFERANAKEMLARQAGYVSSEQCIDWVQSLRLGKQEAVEKLMQSCGVECFTASNLPIQTEEIYCVNVSSQRLSGLPASLAKSANLLWLDVSNNQLVQLGEDLINNPQLLTLDASHNAILVADSALFHLGNLQELNLSYNRLQFLPETVGRLQSLKELHLRNNELKSLPSSIGEMKSIEYLDLSMNQLTELPASVAELEKLKVLKLSGNPISPEEQRVIRGRLPNGCRVEFD